MKKIERIVKGALPYRIIMTAMLLLYGILCIIPFVLVIIISFTSQDAILNNGYNFFPKALSLDAYRYLFEYSGKLIRGYGVTIFITVVGTLLNVFLTVTMAYPLSRMEFRFHKLVSLWLFITMLFGGGLVPYYILVKQYLHMADTIWVLIIPGLVSSGNVFMLRVFMQGMPESLHESAMLDGADEFYILTRIVVPLMKPGIATIALFSVLQYWNEVFTAKLFIESNKDLLPLQNILDQYTQYINYIMQHGAGAMVTAESIPSDSLLFAMCLIAAGPMLFVFLFFQKYFVSGLTMGAIKN